MRKTGSKQGKKVDFQIAAAPGCAVSVAGTFNNWDPTQNPLRDNPDSGHYKATLVLPQGRHEYKFIVNGEWCTDPRCAESSLNDQGALNSVIHV